MKKTTIISIAIILFSLCTFQSCRQDETEMVPEYTSLERNDKQEMTYLKTEKDTVKTAANLHLDHSGVAIADPPPKDKDQWKQ